MKKLVLLIIKIYQKYISLDHGYLGKIFPNTRFCKFSPSCSQYSYDAINKYGIIKGGTKSLYRLLRCNPFNKGGYDPVN